MDEGIDLRLYLNVLLRYKWHVLGVTFLCGLAAFVALSLQPPRYEATALVAITRPLYQFQFTPNIQNVTDKEAVLQFTGKAGVELATSDILLQEALQALQKEHRLEGKSLFDFRKKINVSTGGDPSILKFKAQNRDPVVVAEIANTVAAMYVRFVNQLYGQSSSQEAFFEQQLAAADLDLKKAEQALIDFQKRNDAFILQAQLNAQQDALTTYLHLSNSLRLLHQNVLGLQGQLARSPAGAPSNLADDLTALMLQLRAFHSQQVNPNVNSEANAIATQPSLPVQIQLPANANLSHNKTAAEQAGYLRKLALTIEAKRTEVKKQSAALPPQILALQEKLQKIQSENAELARRHEVAKNVYTALAQKVGETRIVSQESSGRVRIASYAAVPDRPVGGRLLKTAVAMFLGFLLSVFVVFAFNAFRSPAAEASPRA